MAETPSNSAELYDFHKRLETLLKDVRPIFKDFVAYLRINGLGLARQIKHLENVVRFEEKFLGRRLESCSLSEFKRGLDKLILSKLDEDTKKVYRTSLRKFYMFLLESQGRGKKKTWYKILEFLNSIRIKETEPKIEPITPEEFVKMYEAADNDQMRALISVMYEAGPRSGELLTCRIKDVVVFDDYAEVHVTGKTGQGTLILVRSRADLVKHLQSHPLRNDPDAPLWYMWTRRGLRALSYDAFRMRIKRLAEKAGIKRRIYPHLFRHAAATEKASFLTDREMCIAFRWSKNSKMPARYAHLAVREVRDKILSLYNEKYNIERPKPQKCWRCGEILPANVRFCPRCGAPQEFSEIYRNIMKRQEADELMDILIQHPKVRAAIAEALRELYDSQQNNPSFRAKLEPSKEVSDSSSSR